MITSQPTTSLSTKMVGLFILVAIIGIWTSTFLYNRLNQANQIWATFAQQTSQKQQLFSQLKSDFGYGGARI